MEHSYQMRRQRRKTSALPSSLSAQPVRQSPPTPAPTSLPPISPQWSLARLALKRDDQNTAQSNAENKLEVPPSLSQNGPLQRKSSEGPHHKQNKTGLPNRLKSGIEKLSGLSLDDVQVHYHSSKPAQVYALAYTQGRDIYIGPGQEHHLAHEAWHSVQQKLRQVKPTTRTRGIAINDNDHLEREATIMGTRAERTPQSGYARSQSLFPAQPDAKSEQILSQTGTLPVSATSAQPVAQLMKLSELDTAGLKAGESSTKPLRIFNGKDYHVTIYLNQSTYDKYNATLEKKNGKPNFGLLSDNQFEFDEFHITPGKEHSREHFFYNDKGTPLHQSIKTGTPSSDPNDARWKEYNQIIAKLLGKNVYQIHKAFNQTFGGSRLPENAQEEAQRPSETRFTPSALLRKKVAAQPSKLPTFPGKLAVGQAAPLSQPKSSLEIASATPSISEQEEITSTTQPVSSEENQPASIPPAP
ncbi:MAG TPA: DUF4157 domain-containing protein, partial [Ktedonobacteraceae bacterium]|nr:DUF4157 domain-containing protein [Ktedonobacteraceae bacterium]